MSSVIILSNSSGKDSTAMTLLAIERGIEFKNIFCDTGNELPEVYDYLDYLQEALPISIETLKADFTHQIKRKRNYVDTKWREEGVDNSIIEDALSVLEPTGVPFLDMCLWKGRFPSRMAQFCTQELKQKPAESYYEQYLLDGHDVDSWVGVRADESTKRAQYPEKEPHHDKRLAGVMLCRPILSWTADDVFAIHRKHGIEPNPLYKQGFGRIGCAPCCNESKGSLKNLANRFPAEVARIRDWEALVSKASKRGSGTFFGAGKVPGEKISPIDRVVQWSRTSHGGKQYGLMDQVGISGGCQSSYGLCDAGGLS